LIWTTWTKRELADWIDRSGVIYV